GHNEDIYQPQGDDDDSDGCPSEGSYPSYIGSDNEDEIMNYERETISDNKNIPTIEVNSRFSNAVVYKRALNHYALMNEFEYFIEKSEPTRFTARCAQLTCRWRIHAVILQDGEYERLLNFVATSSTLSCGVLHVPTVIESELRYQPVINLLDAIIERLMNLGDYEICRSNENRAVVKCKGKRWDVILDERRCTCRVWQVKGLPCVHAAAFIVFIRDNDWEKYVDGYFTIEKFKEAYAMEISPMLAMDQWLHTRTEEKIYPPTIKPPVGRPRKVRIKAHDESKKSTSVRDVVNLDIMKRDARILHLKIRINIKLQLVKEDEERVPKLFKVRNRGRSIDGHETMKLASDG
ncbi:transposase, MuDR, partial [Tanacetum coccineum]